MLHVIAVPVIGSGRIPPRGVCMRCAAYASLESVVHGPATLFQEQQGGANKLLHIFTQITGSTHLPDQVNPSRTTPKTPLHPRYFRNCGL